MISYHDVQYTMRGYSVQEVSLWLNALTVWVDAPEALIEGMLFDGGMLRTRSTFQMLLTPQKGHV